MNSCGKSLSPQAQVVVDMQKAICRNYKITDAKPYVTKSSAAMLDLISGFAELGKAFGGQAAQDQMAKDCHGETVVIDEIRVNSHRYLIKYREASGDIKEIPVENENGQWKVSLPGK